MNTTWKGASEVGEVCSLQMMHLFDLPAEVLYVVIFLVGWHARGAFARTCWYAFEVVVGSKFGVRHTAIEMEYLRTYGARNDRLWDKAIVGALTATLSQTR